MGRIGGGEIQAANLIMGNGGIGEGGAGELIIKRAADYRW